MELRQRQVDYTSCYGSRRNSTNRDANNPLHRIATIIEQEGVSRRTIGNRIGKTEATVNMESNPKCDMLLSDLYRWQKALRVPISELLVESEPAFSPPINLRTRLLKMMRSVRSIQEHSSEDQIQVFARRLSDQLMELMPELEEVTAWPTVGQIRKPHELGAIACNIFDENVLNSHVDSNE